MSKSKPHGKDKKKSAQLVLRVEKAERDAFVALCEAQDTSAAREIRRFMRDYVATHAPAEPSTPVVEAEAQPVAPAATEEIKSTKKGRKAEPVEAPAEAAPEPALTLEAEKPEPKRRKKAAAAG